MTVLGNADFDLRVRRTALITVALAGALVFGIVVIAGGDWIPGGITVVAALVGLARQIPVIRDLCAEEPASSVPRPPGPARPVRAPGPDDHSHTPPHGDALLSRTRR
jgi:hypothetical protein